VGSCGPARPNDQFPNDHTPVFFGALVIGKLVIGIWDRLGVHRAIPQVDCSLLVGASESASVPGHGGEDFLNDVGRVIGLHPRFPRPTVDHGAINADEAPPRFGILSPETGQ
jgi:hypothetical protein